jgi:Undecaprenyl-phosphate glucose phosphotransferase
MGTLAHIVSDTYRTSHEGQAPLGVPLWIVKPIVILLDVIGVSIACVWTGIEYHWLFLSRVPEPSPYIVIGLLASLNCVTLLIACGAYNISALLDLQRQLYTMVAVFAGVLLLLLAVIFFLKLGSALSRGAMVGFAGVGLLLLLLLRLATHQLLVTALARGLFSEQRMIVIGERDALSRSSAVRDLRQCGYVPTALFEIDDPNHSTVDLQDVLRSAIGVAREQAVELVILVMSWENALLIDRLLAELSVLPAQVHLVPDQRVAAYLRQTCTIGSVWTAELRRAPLNKVERAFKRFVDVVGAGLGLVLLCPLMIVVALLIKVDSPGPIFFTQSRIGFNGRPFRILKFRTMRVLEDGAEIRQATRHDTRCTYFGCWLRRTSIDELPQLLNVLRGEMSLVGPRPHATAHDCEFERKIASYAFRYHVKPGITGWAQVNGYRGETKTVDMMAKRVELDLWYIKNWNMLFDVRILLRTVMQELVHPTGY